MSGRATRWARRLDPEGPSQRAQVLRVIALTILPLLLLAVAALWWDLNESQARVSAEHVATAQSAALTANYFVSDSLTTVRSLAVSPTITDPSDSLATAEYLARVIAVNPDWDGLGIIDPAGWNDAGTLAPTGTVNIADRPYFQQLKATGQAVVSPTIIGRASGNPTVILAALVDFAAGGRGHSSCRSKSPSSAWHCAISSDRGAPR
jgi:hypothetical protein